VQVPWMNSGAPDPWVPLEEVVFLIQELGLVQVDNFQLEVSSKHEIFEFEVKVNGTLRMHMLDSFD